MRQDLAAAPCPGAKTAKGGSRGGGGGVEERGGLWVHSSRKNTENKADCIICEMADRVSRLPRAPLNGDARSEFGSALRLGVTARYGT
jgi:hypothetical protein